MGRGTRAATSGCPVLFPPTGIPEGIMNERSVPFTCGYDGILLVEPAGEREGGDKH